MDVNFIPADASYNSVFRSQLQQRQTRVSGGRFQHAYSGGVRCRSPGSSQVLAHQWANGHLRKRACHQASDRISGHERRRFLGPALSIFALDGPNRPIDLLPAVASSHTSTRLRPSLPGGHTEDPLMDRTDLPPFIFRLVSSSASLRSTARFTIYPPVCSARR